MKKYRQLIIPAILLGIVLIVVAIIYWTQTEANLPSFFPGHTAGSSAHHTKHGIAAFLLGIACFVFAWFQTGPAGGKKGSSAQSPGS